MDKQMKKWDDANFKMERILSIHRRRGLLTDETPESEAIPYLIPSQIKFRIVADLVKAKRREFILSLDDIKEKANNQTSFSTHDATKFLKRKTKVYGAGMPDLDSSAVGKVDIGGRSKAQRLVLQFVFFRYFNFNHSLCGVDFHSKNAKLFNIIGK